ncbi:MAG: YbaN family protein [Pseudomonadota bacterium]
MRRLYLAAGVFFVGLGAVGAVLPLLPTVPFLLLAVFCFARSNPAWEQRILDHPTWGPQIMEWRERRAISRKAKLGAIATLLAGIAFTWVTIGFPWVWISVGVLVVIGGWIATRPE